jgi:hypothetical protein
MFLSPILDIFHSNIKSAFKVLVLCLPFFVGCSQAELPVQVVKPVPVVQAPAPAPKPEFNPIGKTVEEIKKEWGEPMGKLEILDTVQWTYTNGVVSIEKDKVMSFEQKTSQSQPVASGGTRGGNDSGDAVRLQMNRLAKEMQEKSDELSANRKKASDEITASSSTMMRATSQASRMRNEEEIKKKYNIPQLEEDIKRIGKEMQTQREKQ